MKNQKRRLISFDKDIIEDVYEKFDGKYTREQIKGVFDASMSYIHNLSMFSKHSVVRIPYVGTMVCNKKDMEQFVRKMDRFVRSVSALKGNYQIEYNFVKDKIEKIKHLEESGLLKKGDPLVKDNRRFLMHLRNGERFDDVQDKQNSFF